MEGVMNRETVKELIKNVQVPVVLKNICNWPLLNWTLDDWEKQMPSGNLAFRCNPVRPTREPCWERNCQVKDLPFKKFIDIAKSDPKDWFYFDYKYVHQWFKADSEFSKQIKWDAFGFPEAGASESTLWVGSRGAHTPCHQDTYGRNIVLQVYGSKRWLLFPPECGGMKPTRVPYEESSIYSQLNFHLPTDLTAFGGISGCRMVVLEPGDVLVVPNRWWHYVEHVSQIGITINSWIPTEDLDAESRVGEAITRLIVAQICKDLPEKCLPYILNPNEDDLQDIPLSVNLLQVESTVVKCLAQRPKKNPAKRIKLSECENSTNTGSSSGDAAGISNSHKESKTTTDKVNMVEGNQIITDKVIAVEKNNRTTDKVIVVEKNRINIDKVIGESGNHILVVKEISKSDLLDILNENIKNNFSKERTESWSEDEENNGELKGDHFTSAIIRALSQPTVIENIKNNLLNSFT